MSIPWEAHSNHGLNFEELSLGLQIPGSFEGQLCTFWFTVRCFVTHGEYGQGPFVEKVIHVRAPNLGHRLEPKGKAEEERL